MPRGKPKIAKRPELLQLLTDSAREGSVTAAKTLLEELRREEGDQDGNSDGFEALDAASNVTPLRRSG